MARRRPSAALFVSVLLSGCAAFAPRIAGTSGPVSWRATDLKIETRTVQGEPQDVYAFVLVLTETQGERLTFTKIDYTVSKHGSTPAMRSNTGRWVLPARGEFRVPLSSWFYCRLPGECLDEKRNTPLWTVLLSGADDRGRPVRVAIELVLPPDPSSVSSETAKASAVGQTVPPKTLTEPEKPATAPAAPITATAGGPRTFTIPIQVINNVVLVPATFNGSHGATLLLDTGAQYTVVTPALAARLNFTPRPNTAKRSISIVGGQKIEVPFVRLPALEIGTVTLADIEVGVYAVAPESPIIDGLLGADVLSRYRVTVDHAARQLRLETGK